MNMLYIRYILISVLLTVSVIPSLYASNEATSYSELPSSYESVISELKVRNTEMRKCSERKRCTFLMYRSEYLLNQIKTFREGVDPLKHLERKYGKVSYDYVRDNKDIMEMKLDEYFTKGVLLKSQGKILSKDNGMSESEIWKIYEDYVVYDVLPELTDRIRKSRTQRMKAYYAYWIQYLLSDERLQITSKK